MEFLAEYGLFFLKTITFVIAAAVVIGLVAANSQKGASSEGEIQVESLNDQLKDYIGELEQEVISEEELKKRHKSEKKQRKQEKKLAKKSAKKGIEESSQKRVFVLEFDGDVHAHAAEPLRKEITAVLGVASQEDEVVIKLESPGGVVHGYGFAASQLRRIRDKGIPLTICVDKVAASGGYMMACIANKIIAAPFAMIGSIGVVAQIPNFNKVLKKHDVDIELHTAGEYKRTLTMLGENTDEDRKKFTEDLEDIHGLFKTFVSENRPALDIAAVATGEVWFGTKALENNLIDELGTSDQYISEATASADVFSIKYKEKQTWQSKVGLAVEESVKRSTEQMFVNLWSNRFK